MSVQSQSLAMIRRRLNTFLDGTAIIQTNTPGSSGPGYPTDNFSASGTVSCRLLPLSRTTQSADLIALSEEGRTYYTLIIPYTASIEDGNRVVVAGITYEVKQVDTERTDKADKQAMVVKFG